MATPVDLNTIHVPAVGTAPPVTWGTQIRSNFESLVDPPACSTSGALTVVPSGTATSLPATGTRFDTAGMHPGTTNYQTAQYAGRYLLSATVLYQTNSTGDRQTSFRINFGTPVVLMNTGAGAFFATVHTGVRTIYLNVGDIVDISVNQGSGVGLSCGLQEMYMRWIGRT